MTQSPVDPRFASHHFDYRHPGGACVAGGGPGSQRTGPRQAARRGRAGVLGLDQEARHAGAAGRRLGQNARLTKMPVMMPTTTVMSSAMAMCLRMIAASRSLPSPIVATAFVILAGVMAEAIPPVDACAP